MAGYSEDNIMFRTTKISMNRARQQGNLGGYILAILFFGAFLTLAGRLGPLYMDHNTMSNLLDKMAQEQGMGNLSDGELQNAIKKRFKLNNIREFDIKEHIEIERTGSGTELIMDYEVRMPLVHNVDLIASFEKEVRLRD
jgi:hypothetical protein